MFLGPRKLPQIAKTIGKTMADFRNTTNEFKATWQREVDFEEELSALRTGDLAEPDSSPTVPRIDSASQETNTIAAPRIEEADADRFDIHPVEQSPDTDESTNEEITGAGDDLSDKRNWL